MNDVGDRYQCDDVDIEIPNWAQMEPPTNQSPEAIKHLLFSRSDSKNYANVVVQNSERTWEKFFAKAVRRQQQQIDDSKDEDSPFSIKPEFGFLAPKGGANNACDENKPYLDYVKLTVFVDLNCEVLDEGDDWWLVILTESQSWYFRLDVIH